MIHDYSDVSAPDLMIPLEPDIDIEGCPGLCPYGIMQHDLPLVFFALSILEIHSVEGLSVNQEFFILGDIINQFH